MLSDKNGIAGNTGMMQNYFYVERAGQVVIGTAAYCGSGQDTLADSICRKYKMNKYSMGDEVRGIAVREGKNLDRYTLQSIRKECDIKYGRMYFPEIIAGKIKSADAKRKNCVITGIRTMEEYGLFKRKFDFKLIFLTAEEEIRMERMMKRGSEKDSQKREELMEQMDRELAMFDYGKLCIAADLYLDFSMPLEYYREHEDSIVAGIMERLRDNKFIHREKECDFISGYQAQEGIND